MRSSLLKVGVFIASVVLVVGCGKKETSIPTNLEQPLPKTAAPVGGAPGGAGGDKKAGAAAGSDKKSGAVGGGKSGATSVAD